MLINCKNCAYWFQVETQPGWGECRKGCPDPIVLTNSNPHFIGAFNCRAVWSYTGMLDWCGEGEAKGRVKDELEVAIPNQTASLSPNTFNEAVAKAVKKRMS